LIKIKSVRLTSFTKF